jgi:hypothetical protein
MKILLIFEKEKRGNLPDRASLTGKYIKNTTLLPARG